MGIPLYNILIFAHIFNFICLQIEESIYKRTIPIMEGKRPAFVESRLNAITGSSKMSFMWFLGLLCARWFKWNISNFILIIGLFFWVYSLITLLILLRECIGMLKQNLKEKSKWANTAYQDQARDYDIFISYKSEDVHKVRPIVDQLLASGLKVWFAEYMVLLVNWNFFEREIKEGIKRSRYGILFTNNRYSESKHCQLEIETLLSEDGPGKDKILEIKMPDEPGPHRRYPELKKCRNIGYNEINIILDFIGNQLNQAIINQSDFAKNDSMPSQYVDNIIGYKLTLPGWSQPSDRMGTGQKEKLLQFEGMIDRHKVRWNLVIGSGVAAPRQMSHTGLLDDREVMNNARNFAELYLEKHGGFSCQGVHLFFLSDLSTKDKYFTHLVLTYWAINQWHRRYSIVFPEPAGHNSIEFAFTFAFEGSFEDYCKYAFLFDQIVLSLQYHINTV